MKFIIPNHKRAHNPKTRLRMLKKEYEFLAKRGRYISPNLILRIRELEAVV